MTILYAGATEAGFGAKWYCSLCGEYFTGSNYLQCPPAHSCPTGILALQNTPQAIADRAKSTEEIALSKFKSSGSKSDNSHYHDSLIQPIDLIVSAKLPFLEGEVVAVMCRWRKKGGVKDLKKALGYIQLLIDLEGTQE